VRSSHGGSKEASGGGSSAAPGQDGAAVGGGGGGDDGGGGGGDGGDKVDKPRCDKLTRTGAAKRRRPRIASIEKFAGVGALLTILRASRGCLLLQ
jgi:hypothetical protein